MDFSSAYAQGFARVAACTVPVTVADPAANARTVLEQVRACHDDGVAVAVFPELALCGYAIDDLLLQDTLLDAVLAGLAEIVAGIADLTPVVVVGAPLVHGTRLLNCAVVVHRGRVLGVAPKSYLPDLPRVLRAPLVRPRRRPARRDDPAARSRTSRSGPTCCSRATDVPGLVLHVEVCEDMWVPVPPSAEAALAGATVLANLSGSPITVARAEDRRLLVRSASARCLAAYVYAAAGQGESTTDLSWDGQTMVYECGDLLAESERFPDGPRRSVADVDLDRIRQERLRQGTFDDNRRGDRRSADLRTVAVRAAAADRRHRAAPQGRPVPVRARRPRAAGARLLRGLQHPGLRAGAAAARRSASPKVVIGVSGGLDSTHALIVAARAMDRLGRPRSDIHAFTMPGFATGDDDQVATPPGSPRALGVTFEEIDITAAARQMLADLDHPFADGEEVYDVTFENVQAGLRTDYLFRLANHRGGIVLGTGDLSELALGWCTYGVGDQMSHYGVNAGVPKTLVQHLIRWVADSGEFERRHQRACCARSSTQEITPELVPTREDSRSRPRTSVGPYALQDFTLFHVLRHGYRPRRIAFLAQHAWRDAGRGGVAAGLPGGRAAGVRPGARSGTGSRSSCSGSSPASSSGRRCPTAPRSAPAAR